jgi:hypothetical protein
VEKEFIIILFRNKNLENPSLIVKKGVSKVVSIEISYFDDKTNIHASNINCVELSNLKQ